MQNEIKCKSNSIMNGWFLEIDECNYRISFFFFKDPLALRGIFFWNARIIFWSAAMSEANKVCKKASVTYNLFLTEVKWPPPLANFFVCANTAQFIIYTIELVLPSLITCYTKINVTIAITISIDYCFFKFAKTNFGVPD